MSDRDMTPETTAQLRAELYAEIDRRNDFIRSIVLRYPAYRKHIATSELGSAIALADSFGVSAEEFLARLRAQYGVAPELIPPPENLS